MLKNRNESTFPNTPDCAIKKRKKPSINFTSSGRSKNLNSSGFYNNIFAEIRLKTRYYTPKIGNR